MKLIYFSRTEFHSFPLKMFKIFAKFTEILFPILKFLKTGEQIHLDLIPFLGPKAFPR